MTNQLTKEEIKPGDHITLAGVVTEVDDIGLITIKTKSGWEITFNPKDIQTHRPKDNDGYFVKTTEFESYKKRRKE